MSSPVGPSPVCTPEGLKAAFKKRPRQHPALVPVHDPALHLDQALRLDRVTRPEAVAQHTVQVIPVLLARRDLPVLVPVAHVTPASQGLQPVRYS